ncbi:MAG: 1-acyl-sn-glycerol-3-phosphate acyltransferase [Salinivirgaceae bacterium]|nr:1-acyl-sn-glycerol-3-phosphate acyltransferase [Salinivirgaceae bacterium]
MKRFNARILKLFGWTVVGDFPTDKKYVVISLPHTSMWDFVWGKITFASAGERPVVFIKKEMFFFPLGLLLKALGARPINRSHSAGMVEQVLEYFNKNERFSVCITPEGTRKRTNKLKRGFYFIAKQANVPVYLGFLSYKDKTVGFGERYMLSGDIEKDMAYIHEYYVKLNPAAKHPENFSLDSIRL